MEARITIDDGQVLAMLERLRGLSGGRALPVMQDIGRFMKTSMQLRFRTQTSPDGQRWWPSNRAGRKKTLKTLVASGRLLHSLTWRAGPNFAEAGTNVVYAAAHNFGIRKVISVPAHRRMTKGRNKAGGVSVRSHQVKGHARLMFQPRRQFAGFSAADLNEILLILAEGVQALARR